MASKQLFYQKGYDDTLYDDICKLSGVHRSLIPYHFVNKKDLAITVYDSFMDAYVDKRSIIEEGCTPEEKLILGLLFCYRLLEDDNVARFVSYISNEESYLDRLVLGDSVMFKKVIPQGKKFTQKKWNHFMPICMAKCWHFLRNL